MNYAVLHYEYGGRICEYTLQECTMSLLKDAIRQAQFELREYGKCLVFYFNDKTIEKFDWGVFRF